MKYGTINCTCGQQFYFEKSENIIGYDENYNPIFIVNCIRCKKTHDVSDYPEKIEEPTTEVGDQNGTDI